MKDPMIWLDKALIIYFVDRLGLLALPETMVNNEGYPGGTKINALPGPHLKPTIKFRKILNLSRSQIRII